MILPTKNFSKFSFLEIPDLLAHQRESFERFKKEALQKVFVEHFPIFDYSEKDLKLEFIDYYIGKPKNTEAEARRIMMNYEAPLRVKLRLVNLATQKYEEQEIYFGDLPIMTERGSFIINGNERVIISQMVRSPAVYFNAVPFGERKLFGAKIIPQRGSWLEFQLEPTNALMVRINRQKKFFFSVLFKALGISSEEIVSLFQNENDFAKNIINVTLKKDEIENRENALLEIHRKLRPFEPNTLDNASFFFENMFLAKERYSLDFVGRFKLNERLDGNSQNLLLEKNDLVAIAKEVLRLSSDPLGEETDIDSLENRRIRDIAELLENQARIGFTRLIKNTKDRMSALDLDKTQIVFPSQVIYPRILINTIREFFNVSPLSQVLDQVNILSEVEHKRRLSAGGPGGLNKERAGFEVRDLHLSHYGKICPIQTPEGGNIGLVIYQSIYSKRNELGFLESPYFKVEKGKITNNLQFLDAKEEKRAVIGTISTPHNASGSILNQEIEARVNAEPSLTKKENLQFIEVSPFQLFSVATGSIPFLEHDDANRAQMGSNMQKQAVPLIRPEAPLVNTGIEGQIAKNSGYLIMAEEDGEILEVDSLHMVVAYKNKKNGGSKEKKIYELSKYQRTNNFSAINQKPIVSAGQKVKKGEPLTDGPSITGGVLSLGHGLTVAFMSWYGYNFEDAIIISERVLKGDVFSSVYLEEFSVDIRDTKLGKEETTADIPNVPESKLRNLDVEGIIRIGAEVRTGDILVGKITPKKGVDFTPEEKLLKAIFGEKVEDIKDSSLYLDPGKSGRVTKIKILEREKGDITEPGVLKRIFIEIGKLRKLRMGDKLANRHGNKGIVSIIVPEEDMPFLSDGEPVDIILNPLGVISRINLGQILEMHLGLAAKKLDYKAIIPPMSGFSDGELKKELKLAGLPEDGLMDLYDGKTGQRFDKKIAVGYLYFMKLTHMVEDKIHSRSIGPYSLITQQPLGGKAQFGGQRLGEMEVWALEGYGAVNILQEMLTIKSDDIRGRAETYTNIIKGEEVKTPLLPSAFNVLVKELKGLGMDIGISSEERVEAEEKLTEVNLVRRVSDR
jgi:DNA-directed RNA polymerase subunit beta